ncbi:hypothetical protein LPJ77_000037 [Coemansia sp. RSA 2523]|nr:hypothetical protein LPJ77_000037 [Coemansia sp. RSA 2523]
MKFPSVALLCLVAQTIADTPQSSSSDAHESSSALSSSEFSSSEFSSSEFSSTTPESSLSGLELGALSPTRRSDTSHHDASLLASEQGPQSPIRKSTFSDHDASPSAHEPSTTTSTSANNLAKCSDEGAQMCAASDHQQYMQCTKGEWTEQSCGSNTVCAQTSANKVECQTPGSQSSSSSNPTPTTQIKCDTNGASMCDSTAKNSYFQCTKNIWQEMACDSGTECRVSNNKVICADPNAPVESETISEPKIACDTNNSTMCDDSDASAFYMCTDKFWTKMQCDGENVCMARNGKTACVDKATADAPVQPCTVEKATQCVPDNRNRFQICIDNYWTNSTCADDSYCLLRGDSTVCVDKATADAPVLPCTKANATRCINEDSSVYQLCYEGFWSNSTCDKGNVCGMKQGSALCHDPDQPIIDVPDQPCNKDKASQCVSGNETLYQVCSNKLWTNLTCDGNNICRMKDDKVMCVDKDEAYMSLTQLTMHEPTPYKGMLSLGVSARDAYSWGTSVLLGAIAITFGVGL